MIRVEVINEDFTLQKFDELKNIKRKGQDTYGKLYIGDSFDCTEDMAKYLAGANPLKKAFIKVIEVLPKEKPKEETPIEVKFNTEIKIDSEKVIEKIEKQDKPKKKKNKK